MANLAIIPARGGSKRIPHKNIKNFYGKPIISYSIQAALDSGKFERVMVSTDDEEIADIAKKYGAEVPFLRSAENATDFATTFAVLEEVLNRYNEAGQKFEYGCCIYPAAPFVTGDALDKAYNVLVDKLFDVVFPAVEYSFPIGRSISVNEDGKAWFNWPENALTRSQDMPKAYHDAGQFYWFNVAALLKSARLVPQNSGVIIINDMDAHDIDSITDWQVAEFKYKFKQNLK